MHELSLMEEVVTAVTRASLGVRVHLVRLVVGEKAPVSPVALRTCFEVCVAGTVLDGAQLDIVRALGDELRLEEVEVS
jgi:hydrogenase nickel incorporation protein HypA/HybF